MNNSQKMLILVMCAVLLVAGSVFGTFAYLTDTEAVTNTFTVGQVGLKLDETDVDIMGVKDGDTRVTENAYHLLPGHTYIKDPTVTVDAGSEDSYVRMIVTVTFAKELNDSDLATNLDSIFTGYQQTVWPRYNKTVSTDKKTITYEYRYYTTVDGKDDSGKSAETKLEPLFTAIKVPGEYTNEQIAVLANMNINIVAHAVQASGFNPDTTNNQSAEDVAWAAFDVQNPSK